LFFVPTVFAILHSGRAHAFAGPDDPRPGPPATA
jgi:hypothetical protein